MTQDIGQQPPTTGDVFVSHASGDAAIARAFVEALERDGITCWIAPRDIAPGTLYADGIVRAINGAKVFLLVLSERAVASSHVGKEIERASSKGRPIVSVRIDAAPLSPAFEYFLSESQWIDLPRHDATALAKLIEAMTHLVGQTRAEQSTAPETSEANIAVSRKSIAVLPFTDMSEKKDQEYLADGMAEEIINLLAKAPDLLVPARTSSFYFKGKPAKASEIARELGVAHILEGSIRQSGNRLRVTAQLIRADTGYHVWSETYNRELRDVFELQDDIANAVAQSLQIKLMGGELSPRRGGTHNLEAYQFYLRGLNAQSQNTQASVGGADDYLKQAIELDPNFGLAWAQRAAGVVVMTENGFLSPTEGYERARQLAQTASQLSPDLADAHAWLQYVHRTLDWDWAAAEAEGRRAIALDATNPWAMNVGGLLAITLGRWDEAERKFRSALVRDPLNTYLTFNLGGAYYGAGRFAEAESVFRRVQQIEPGFLWTRAYLAKTLLAMGDPEAALATIQQERSVFGLMYLPPILDAAGRPVEADQALQAQISAAESAGAAAYFVALTYAYRGNHDLALEWLERAYDGRAIGLCEILSEHLLKDLVLDVRFKAFLRKMNLPE